MGLYWTREWDEGRYETTYISPEGRAKRKDRSDSETRDL